MINYLTIGADDINKTGELYDAVLAALGYQRCFEDPGRKIGWGSIEQMCFCITKPFDGESATSGNGTMIGFTAGTEAEVDEAYNRAMKLGATDEGEPGWRSDQFYGAYFRDYAGNKITVFLTT